LHAAIARRTGDGAGSVGDRHLRYFGDFGLADLGASEMYLHADVPVFNLERLADSDLSSAVLVLFGADHFHGKVPEKNNAGRLESPGVA
jgi:hypothetical protein